MPMPILIALTLQAGVPPYGPLDLLIEDWVCRSERLASGPVWRFLKISRDGDGLTGQSGTYASRDGRRAERQEASLRITGRNEAGRLVYTRRDGTRIEYRLRASGHEGVMFETEANVAPQRIAFRYGSFHLEVTTSQRDGGNAVTTHYARPGLRSAIPVCEGGS